MSLRSLSNHLSDLSFSFSVCLFKKGMKGCYKEPMKERILVKGLCNLKSAVRGARRGLGQSTVVPDCKGEHSNSNNKTQHYFMTLFHMQQFSVWKLHCAVRWWNWKHFARWTSRGCSSHFPFHSASWGKHPSLHCAPEKNVNASLLGGMFYIRYQSGQVGLIVLFKLS